MWSNRRRRRDERGFTLLEVLIAFAILAVAMAMLFRAFSTGLSAGAKARDWTTAVALARSGLDRIGADIPLKEGMVQEVAGDGTIWTARIERAAMTNNVAAGAPVALYQVVVSVPIAGGGAFSLTSLRLGAGPGGNP